MKQARAVPTAHHRLGARCAGLLGASILTWTASASGTVTEPNGAVVPTDDTGSGEMRLDAFFAAEGEPVDWRADAFATPATFSPLCGFRATLERVDSGSKFGVGWYNVDPNATTPPADVYEIIPQNATPGQQFTGDDIRSSPDYTGGLIGFALIRTGQTPAYHYSEAKWNTYCDLGCFATPGNWALSLTYQSKNVPNAWYMGFEDGATSNLGWSNDGDFNDSLFFFEGLACAGAGEPCTVEGAQGECAAGVTECSGSGIIECRQVTQPTVEACDAIDNDCNGSIDDGDGLCAADEVCFRGTCEPACGRGEFQCAQGEECVESVCVDAACAAATCDADQACVNGECIVPCAGVVCPGEQTCRLGRCVDACEGVTCDAGRVCEGGVCLENCECRGCDAGFSCQTGAHVLAGRCVPASCLDVDCEDDAACTASSGGTCAPLCNDAVVCPLGQACEAGICVDVAVDAGPGSGPEPPPSFGGTFTDPPPVTAGTGGTGASAQADGGMAPRQPAGPVAGSPGCGCRVGPSTDVPAAVWASASMGLLGLARSRRRRRAVHRR